MRTLVVHPFVKNKLNPRSAEARLAEACGLAEAIMLEVVQAELFNLKTVRPNAYIGKGKVEELGLIIKNEKIGLVVMDCALTPIQQRNLEKAWNAKVIDRTALILEIFGERAKTKEGSLQVELASLEYQKSRLVRSWTHLERQRGGFGFLGGPGETQIEIDRRLIRDRIAKIKRELEKVKQTRGLHRKSQQKVPYPVVALVGYTNAGKSTLFNKLTGADVFAENLLFATLDPTMRTVTLPSGQKIILSDTVGFISDLPTQLVAAFHATLEEVIEADLILHVRDISSPDSDAQKDDVIAILKSLGIEDKISDAMFEVLNKIDLLDKEMREGLARKGIPVSALEGTGCNELLVRVDEFLSRGKKHFRTSIAASDGKLLAWLYAHGENIKTNVKDDSIDVELMLSDKDLAQFQKINNSRK